MAANLCEYICVENKSARNQKQVPSKYELHVIVLNACRYKDGMEIRPGGKYRIVEDDDKVQLIVRGVDKDDDGEITCELSNSKGKEAATAKLRVQSKHLTLFMLWLLIWEVYLKIVNKFLYVYH